jgi:hypothetical protein
VRKMNSALYWNILCVILLVAYLVIQFTVKNKKKYFTYFISGMVFGFFFDIVSFTQGYYSYPTFYKVTLLGLPVSMTIAEGFSVAIAMYIIEFVKRSYDNKSVSLKNLP